MPKLSTGKRNPSRSHHITDAAAREIYYRLSHWFERNQRDLKFRESTDPYAIMVSEFMLQQTTVAAVEPYYARFLKKYPTVESLASALEADVMTIWAGLGYYRRARQLHAAAKTLINDFHGSFPSDPDILKKLPGFGRYTAGAVASQAFDRAAPIVEANTVRVFSRLAGVDGVVGDSFFMNHVWGVSEILVVNAPSPRIFNRAAMELGALVCRPKPLCQLCPLQPNCAAYIGGFTERIPRSRPKKENVAVDVVCLAIKDPSGRYAVRKNRPGQWHAGLWEFPTKRAAAPGTAELLTVAHAYAESLGILINSPQPLLTLKYQVTHHRVVCTVFHCHALKSQAERHPDDTGISFLTVQEIFKLPLGSAQKKLLRHLETLKG